MLPQIFVGILSTSIAQSSDVCVTPLHKSRFATGCAPPLDQANGETDGRDLAETGVVQRPQRLMLSLSRSEVKPALLTSHWRTKANSGQNILRALLGGDH